MLFREQAMTAFIRTLTSDMDETKEMQKEAARIANLGYHDSAVRALIKEWLYNKQKKEIDGHFKTG